MAFVMLPRGIHNCEAPCYTCPYHVEALSMSAVRQLSNTTSFWQHKPCLVDLRRPHFLFTA